MKPQHSLPPTIVLIAFFAAILIFPRIALAAPPTERPIHHFRGAPNADGATPDASLVADLHGNLYGTTAAGGTAKCVVGGTDIGCGTVFELSPPAALGDAWTETVLYSFKQGSDGHTPSASLILDPQGNLYGTTTAADNECGTVFRLAPPTAKGDPWTLTVVYALTRSGTGCLPAGGLVRDEAGNLYGTTLGFGEFSCGAAFQLTPPPTEDGAWTETTLHSFSDTNGDGAYPLGNLILGKGGDLYGVTEQGGVSGQNGTVYRLTPPKPKGGAWNEELLHSFKGGSDGKYPLAGLVFDGSGNLYGTTYGGGSGCGSDGCGSVFRLARPLTKGPWTKTVLYDFVNGSDGANPLAALVFDKKGNLYGTTSYTGGYENGSGAVFELSPPAEQGDPWTETTLHDFTGGRDGSTPRAGLIRGKDGALYGTTALTNWGNRVGNGTVFKIVP
jgi:uncharacterized repeat protein (TIGR03803 family)